MRKAILPTLCILLCTLCICFIPTEAEASIYGDTVRLHILAPSDSTEDQHIKLLVRDMILENYAELFSEAKTSRVIFKYHIAYKKLYMLILRAVRRR